MQCQFRETKNVNPKKTNEPLLQGKVEQTCRYTLVPEHALPPPLGAGLLHTRYLVLQPPPHDLLHAL